MSGQETNKGTVRFIPVSTKNYRRERRIMKHLAVKRRRIEGKKACHC